MAGGCPLGSWRNATGGPERLPAACSVQPAGSGERAAAGRCRAIAPPVHVAPEGEVIATEQLGQNLFFSQL